MDMELYESYNAMIEKLKSKEENKCIILTGSARKYSFDTSKEINDIDLFIIKDKQSSDQIREFIKFKGIDYDLNFFSYESALKYMERGEKFIIKAFIESDIIYDSDNMASKLVQKAIDIKNN